MKTLLVFLFESMIAILPPVNLVKKHNGMEDGPDRGLLTRHRTAGRVRKVLLGETHPWIPLTLRTLERLVVRPALPNTPLHLEKLIEKDPLGPTKVAIKSELILLERKVFAPILSTPRVWMELVTAVPILLIQSLKALPLVRNPPL